MENVTNEHQCDCPQECNSISYTYYIDKGRNQDTIRIKSPNLVWPNYPINIIHIKDKPYVCSEWFIDMFFDGRFATCTRNTVFHEKIIRTVFLE